MFQIGLLNFRTGLFGSHFKDSLNNESLDWLFSENIQEKPINLMLKTMVSGLIVFPNRTNPMIEYVLQEWTHMHPVPPIRFPFISKMQMLYKAVPQFVS